jgi:putative membrane protein
MHFLWNILLYALAVFIVAKILPKVHIKSFLTALLVAFVYSIINFLIGWLLTLISLPLILVTFGLFRFVVNAILLWITDKLIADFEIEDFTTTLIAAVLITLFIRLVEILI